MILITSYGVNVRFQQHVKPLEVRSTFGASILSPVADERGARMVRAK